MNDNNGINDLDAAMNKLKPKEDVTSDMVEEAKKIPEEKFGKVVTKLKNTIADLTDYVTIITGDIENSEANITKRLEGITATQLDKFSNDSNHFINRLAQTQNTNTSREKQIGLHAKDVLERGQEIKYRAEGQCLSENKVKFKNKGDLTGNAAKLAILSKKGGVITNYLFNSGFYAVHKPLSLEDLHDIYTTVDEEMADYGRIYSAHSLMMGSVIIEVAVMKAFHNSIVDSNLEGWEDYTTFTENVHSCDYDAILLGIVRLMFPKGVEISQVCVSKDCDHVATFNLDIKELRMDNVTLLSDKMFLDINSDKRTAEDLKAYREELFPSKQYKIDDGLMATFKPPMMDVRLSVGVKVIANILKKLKSNKRYRTEDLVKVDTAKMIKPWIENILVLDDEGNVESTIKDYDAICDTIGTTLIEAKSIYEDLVEYSSSNRITYIGHKPTRCPVCKNISNDTTYLQLGDIQTLFFISVHQLLTLMKYQIL